MRLARYGWTALATVAFCGAGASLATDEPWRFDLPKGFPRPIVPADNPMTAAKVELGRHLFYDARLSENQRQSCATCHVQALAFTDGRGRAIGSTGDVHPRGSMSLANIAYASALTWGDPSVHRLEDQVRTPLFGTDPVELGHVAPGDLLVARLKSAAKYEGLFAAAFPEDKAVSVDHAAKALASFERTIISSRSPYDRYRYEGVEDAISPSAKRGEVLFFSSALSCFVCHGGFNFSGAVQTEALGPRPAMFHNNGLYNMAGASSYPAPNRGVFEITHDPKDVGRFKAPTLRNIAVTSPYMHDGSIETLEGVIDHYAAGGRTLSDGPLAGVGRDNPNKSETIRGFTLTREQRSDLIAFLNSLTDEALLTDRRFSGPRR